jgi:hypothetical protein
MTKKGIIKMILLQFGYRDIEIQTFWTGTGDGQFENSLAYEIEAVDKNGYALSIRESCFKEAILEIFYEVTNTDCNDGIIEYIDDEDFNQLK